VSISIAVRRRVRSVLILGPVLAMLTFGCSQAPLPEAGSKAAGLYVEKCGTCHRVFYPSSLTPKMWEAMVSRMEIEMSRRGMTLGAEDKTEILDYLSRNAGVR
jgi:hypothetical protein